MYEEKGMGRPATSNYPYQGTRPIEVRLSQREGAFLPRAGHLSLFASTQSLLNATSRCRRALNVRFETHEHHYKRRLHTLEHRLCKASWCWLTQGSEGVQLYIH